MLFVGYWNSCGVRRNPKVSYTGLYGVLYGGEWNLLIRNIFVNHFGRRGGRKNHVTMRLELRKKKPYEASIVLFREISEEI